MNGINQYQVSKKGMFILKQRKNKKTTKIRKTARNFGILIYIYELGHYHEVGGSGGATETVQRRF